MSSLQAIKDVAPLVREEGQDPFGVLTTRYRVRRVVRLGDNDGLEVQYASSYVLEITHRIVIPSQKKRTNSSFSDYPVLLQHSVMATLRSSAVKAASLLAYEPKTINSSVETSASTSDGKANTQSRHQSWGSSQSGTTSYGVSLSAGMFGETPTFDVSGNYSESTTIERNQSNGLEDGHTTDKQSAKSDSMSIKNWCSVATADLIASKVSWTWAQEYPYNVLQFQSTDANNGTIALPQYVIDRLFAEECALPPSDLSLFGIDFVSKSTWLVTCSAEESPVVVVEQTINFCVGNHAIDKGGVKSVRLTNVTPSAIVHHSKPIDLPFLALEVIKTGSVANGAILGFCGGRFLVPPRVTGTFSIVSARNNLLVRGSGFDEKMNASLSGTGKATITVFFKLLDPELQLSLHLRHWRVGSAPCLLRVITNGNEKGLITKHVDAAEASGGEANLLAISLRSTDHLSNDYHDYLVEGTNRVDIEVLSPISDAKDCVYALRALAIA